MLKLAEESFGRNIADLYPVELHFRRLLDTLPAAAYTCDSQGLITYFNRRAEQVWGRSPELNDPVDRFCGSCSLVDDLMDISRIIRRQLELRKECVGLTLAEMHDGTITVSSEGMGRGSEFIVRLPATDRPSKTPGDTDHENEKPVSASSLRILVVDDDRDSTVSLSMLLQIMGHEARVAHDGPQAVDLIGEYRPDVVLLDIGLPGMNGYEVARKIRQESWGRQITLIALTGWGQEEDRRQSEEAGFDYHLVKPVEAPALSQLLASINPAG